MIQDPFYTTVKNYIDQHKMIAKGDSILLSVSAGKDSMALLDVLYFYKDDYQIDLSLFHLNHCMRGKESDEDAEFVSNLARQYSLPLYLYTYDFKDTLQATSSFEEQARNKRYELIDKLIEEKEFRKVATAHTRNDNVETMCMRFFQGTSIWGLQGIPRERGHIIRPLLCVSSSQVYTYLHSKSLAWREDQSNQDSTYTRNYLRTVVFPELHKRFPHMFEAVDALSAHSEIINSLLAALLEEKYNKYMVTVEGTTYIEVFTDFYKKDIFYYYIADIIRKQYGAYVTSGMLDEIFKKFCSPKTHIVLYQKDFLKIIKTLHNQKLSVILSRGNSGDEEHTVVDWRKDVDLDFETEKIIEVNDVGWKFECKWVTQEKFKEEYKLSDRLFIDVHAEESGLTIRNKIDGDRICLQGKQIKIKKLCINKKCTLLEKQRLPIIEINGKIASVALGFMNKGHNRIHDEYIVTNKSKKILAIYSLQK